MKQLKESEVSQVFRVQFKNRDFRLRGRRDLTSNRCRKKDTKMRPQKDQEKKPNFFWIGRRLGQNSAIRRIREGHIHGLAGATMVVQNVGEQVQASKSGVLSPRS